MIKKLALTLGLLLAPVLAHSAPLFDPGGLSVTNTSTSPVQESFDVFNSTVAGFLRVDLIRFADDTTMTTAASGGTPAGSNGEIQLNVDGAFGSDSRMFVDTTTHVMQLTGTGGNLSLGYEGFALTGTNAKVLSIGNAPFGSYSERWYVYTQDITGASTGISLYGGFADTSGNTLMGFGADATLLGNQPYVRLTNFHLSGLQIIRSTNTTEAAATVPLAGTLVRMDATLSTTTVTLPNIDYYDVGLSGFQIDIQGDRYLRLCKVDSSTNTITFAGTTPGGSAVLPAPALRYQNECQDWQAIYKVKSGAGSISYWLPTGRLGGQGMVVSTVAVSQVAFADGTTMITAAGTSGFSIYPATSTGFFPFGALFSTVTLTSAGPGVLYVVAGSSVIESAASGVINTSTNPVDWTLLKNVPAGFADGTDDGSGGGVSVYPATSTAFFPFGLNASTAQVTSNIIIGNGITGVGADFTQITSGSAIARYSTTFDGELATDLFNGKQVSGSTNFPYVTIRPRSEDGNNGSNDGSYTIYAAKAGSQFGSYLRLMPENGYVETSEGINAAGAANNFDGTMSIGGALTLRTLSPGVAHIVAGSSVVVSVPVSLSTETTGQFPAGVINTSTNPVSWTSLRDVPAGFADGTDDGSGGGSSVYPATSTAGFPFGLSASTVSVSDDAYAAGWNGSTLVPTKNAVYDKIESLSAGSGVVQTDTPTWSGSHYYTGIALADFSSASQLIISTGTDVSGKTTWGSLSMDVDDGQVYKGTSTQVVPISGRVAVQVFTTTGTYTPNVAMVTAYVIVTGGGAAGDLCSNTDTVAGGGGAGATVKGMYTRATIGTSQAVGIGAAATVGLSASPTTFGALITANGGTKSTQTATSTTLGNTSNGGAGGTGTGGDIQVTGGTGTNGVTWSGTAGQGGDGGGSFWGGGGRGGQSGGNGDAGLAYGAGGGGCSAADGTDRNGGAGMPGVVYVMEFLN